MTEEFTSTTKKLHKAFIDMMYQCLAEPYTTRNGSKLLIRVQLQRQCRYAGAARGKEGYAAMHSAFASVQFVTVTFNLNPSDLSWLSVTELDKDLAHGATSTPAS